MRLFTDKIYTVRKAAIIKVLLFCCICADTGQVLYAQTNDQSPMTTIFENDSLTTELHNGNNSSLEIGVKLLTEGQIDSAIEQFTNLLLIDPANKEAKQYLQRCLIDGNDSFPASKKQQILRFLELIDYIHFLNARIMEVTGENKLDEGVESGVNQSNVADFVSQAPKLTDKIKYLASQKDSFVKYFQQNQQIADRLSDLPKIEPGPTKQKVQQQEKKDDVANELVKVEQVTTSLETVLSELNDMKTNSSEMQAKMQQTDKRVAGLTKDIAGVSLELFEKERALTDKENRIVSLETELSDTQERLNLVQQIIREKDERIENLTKDLSQIPKHVENENQESQEVHSIRSALSLLQDKMNEQTVTHTEKIDSLGARIEELNQKYKDLQDQMNEKELQNIKLRTKIVLYDEIVNYKEQKLNQVSGILLIYKDRLLETHKKLINNEDTIESLQQQIRNLQQAKTPVHNSDIIGERRVLNATDIQKRSVFKSPSNLSGDSEVPNFQLLNTKDILRRTKSRLDALERKIQLNN